MNLSPGRTAWAKRADTVLGSQLRPATRLIARQRSDAQDSSLACDEQPVRWAPCLASGCNDRIAPSAAGPAPPDPERKAAVSLVPTGRRYLTRPASYMGPMERAFSASDSGCCHLGVLPSVALGRKPAVDAAKWGQAQRTCVYSRYALGLMDCPAGFLAMARTSWT